MKNKNGFTLIELIGVILLLGILMTLTMVSISSIINSNRKKTMNLSINNYIKSVEQYQIDNSKFSTVNCIITFGVMKCDDVEVYNTKNDYNGTIDINTTSNSVCITDGKLTGKGTIDSFVINKYVTDDCKQKQVN